MSARDAASAAQVGVEHGPRDRGPDTDGLSAVGRLLRRKLLLLVALYIAVLVVTALLLGASLWSTRPYGWDQADLDEVFPLGFPGRNRLLLTFAPTFAAFYWISLLGVVTAVRRRRDVYLATAGLLTAWPAVGSARS